MNRKGKPVRKCHGCILNLGDNCAIYEEPHDKWHNSKCTSYNDQELYHQYLKSLNNCQQNKANKAKKQRTETAKKNKSEEHHQGMKGKGL